MTEIENKKIEDGMFHRLQKEVLKQWPTGADVNFQETIDYHKKLPAKKVFSHKLTKAKKSGTTLIQPRAGVADVDEHIKLLRYLEKEGEADLLPTTIDSYTRTIVTLMQKGLKESMNTGRSMLNGFPAVNHGVHLCRKVNESLEVPVQVRHGTPDARLLAEVSIAGGFSSFEGGGISYNIPYAKDCSLEETIRNWMYVDRLTGMYEENGVSINREPFGPLTGTLVPPCISHSVAVIESLLAAEQGVKNITVGYGQCGNLIQDVAAIKTLEILTEEYLAKYNYRDITISTVFHQWMGGFPQDESKAYGLISWGAAIGVMSGATKVIVKTPHEAMGIPTKEANASGLKTSKQMIAMLQDQKMPLNGELEAEMAIILAETRCILDKVYEFGDGDLVKGTIRAFEAGIIDVPFAPSRYNIGKVIPARDNFGAVRFLEKGNLPFSSDIKDFHRKAMLERAKFEKRDVSYQMVIDDVYAISKGRLIGRPR